MSIAARSAIKALERENKRWPNHLVEIQVPADVQKLAPDRLIRVLRSREFLVQVFDEGDLIRLSVNRTHHDGTRWTDGVTWDELQRITRECGYGECDAVEAFPADTDVVNDANMRHLWVYRTTKLAFIWRRHK